MEIKYTLVDVYKDGALVTIEGDDWIVAIPTTLDDPVAVIDTAELDEIED